MITQRKTISDLNCVLVIRSDKAQSRMTSKTTSVNKNTSTPASSSEEVKYLYLSLQELKCCFPEAEGEMHQDMPEVWQDWSH